MFVPLAVLEFDTTLIVITALVFLGAWLVARNAKRKGYKFGMTFLMATLGLASAGLVVLNLLTYLFE